MAKVKGKDCQFFFNTVATIINGPFSEFEDNPTANWVEFSGSSNDITLSTDARTVDSSAYGDDFDQFEVMTYNWKIDATFYYTPGDTVDTDLLLQANILGLLKYAFSFHPAGQAGGGTPTAPTPTFPEYSGRVLISSVGTAPDRAGLTGLNVSFQGDGELHRKTAAI